MSKDSDSDGYVSMNDLFEVLREMGNHKQHEPVSETTADFIIGWMKQAPRSHVREDGSIVGDTFEEGYDSAMQTLAAMLRYLRPESST